MFTKLNFRPSHTDIATIYIKLNKILYGNNKNKFTSWAQGVENAAKLCNLDTLSIALSKLQGPPLKSAHFLESKEVSSGKQLDLYSLKKHLTRNYLEILYDTHAINAHDNIKVAMSQQVHTCTGNKIFSNIFTTQAI